MAFGADSVIGDHYYIVGRTGSGKSIKALHVLRELVHKNPDAGVLIINHKNEKEINNVLPPYKDLLGRITIPSKLKNDTRINIIPIAGEQDYEVTNLLREVYFKENFIVYIDEGYMINPRNPWLNALFTQGRSKNISVILLSQRPKLVSLFAVTQSNKIFIYNVIGNDDIKTLSNVVRGDVLTTQLTDLPDFNYVEFDAKTGKTEIKQPEKYPISFKIPLIKRPMPILPIVGIVGLVLVGSF